MKVRLIECVKNVFIIAYKEDTNQLEQALASEGFQNVCVIRPSYSQEELGYSRQTRCLLNHKNAWVECEKADGLSIVMEADFVPIKGFAQCPVPFDLKKTGHAWGWLYSSAQRVYEIDDNEYVRGHSAAPVATVLDSKAASVLIQFVNHELSVNAPQEYKPWDTYIRMFVQARGVNSYIPFRSYGEHGGLSNPEHRIGGINPIHRADVLWGQLHFLPAYAKSSKFIYIWCRFKAKFRALLRLLVGRFVEPALLKNPEIPTKQKLRLVSFGVRRLLSIY